MKISDETIEVLKNFSTINSSLLFKKGNTLSTISPLKNVLAVAKINEKFPKEFAIFDLSKMIVKMSLYKKFDLDFLDDRLEIISDDSKSKSSIKYCAQNVFATPPDKNISVDDAEVTFKLTQSSLELQLKNAGSSASPNFVFKGEDGKIKFIATDVDDDSSDKNETIIGETDKEFEIVMKVDNFKIIPGTYNVEISDRGLSKFTNVDRDILYFIAIEAGKSKFN